MELNTWGILHLYFYLYHTLPYLREDHVSHGLRITKTAYLCQALSCYATTIKDLFCQSIICLLKNMVSCSFRKNIIKPEPSFRWV